MAIRIPDWPAAKPAPAAVPVPVAPTVGPSGGVEYVIGPSNPRQTFGWSDWWRRQQRAPVAPSAVSAIHSSDFGDNGGTPIQRLQAQLEPVKSMLGYADLGLKAITPTPAQQAAVAAEDAANAAKLREVFKDTTGFVAGVGQPAGAVTASGYDAYTDPLWLDSQAAHTPQKYLEEQALAKQNANWEKIFQQEINTNTATGKPLTEADLAKTLLTDEQYKRLSPKEQQAVQWNTLLWQAMEQDAQTQVPLDTDQLDKYEKSYKRVFGDDVKDIDKQFYPATIALLDEANYDGTRLSLDDVLAGKATVLDSDYGALKDQAQWRFGPKTEIGGTSGSLPARQQQAFTVQDLVADFGKQYAQPEGKVHDLLQQYSDQGKLGLFQGLYESAQARKKRVTDLGEDATWNEQMRALLDPWVQEMGGAGLATTQSDVDRAAAQSVMRDTLLQDGNAAGAALPSGQIASGTTLPNGQPIDDAIKQSVDQLTKSSGWNYDQVIQFINSNGGDPAVWLARAEQLYPGYTAALKAGNMSVAG